MLRLALIACLIALPLAAEPLQGPVPARVETVVDGDTLKVRARIWIGQEVVVAVRLRGIDAPEMRARCEGEREMAEAARTRLAALVGGGEVTLTAIDGDKYFGRVIADVSAGEKGDVASALLTSGLARPYGGGRREGWCGAPATALR